MPPDSRELVLMRKGDSGVAAVRAFNGASEPKSKVISRGRHRESAFGVSLPTHDSGKWIEVRCPVGFVPEQLLDLDQMLLEKRSIEMHESSGDAFLLLATRRTDGLAIGVYVFADRTLSSFRNSDLRRTGASPPTVGPYSVTTLADRRLRSAARSVVTARVVVDPFRERSVRVTLAASHERTSFALNPEQLTREMPSPRARNPDEPMQTHATNVPFGTTRVTES